jgi:metallophosphoesterase (TIGR00282 family)
MPSRSSFKILALGDIIGKPGRRALAKRLAAIVEECRADFVVANGENASGGLGITPSVADELLGLPIDVLTSGNHIWKHKEIRPYLESHEQLLRPANYPAGSPGKGIGVFSAADGTRVGVINLEGLLFMNPLDCPFHTADRLIDEIRGKAKILLVDFHAEATSEKRALGHYLDKRVTAVFGTHTHIPTADAEVLPGGTGYLTDLGMCGPTDSVIGIRKQQAIARFTTRLPNPFQVASDGLQIQGALIEADNQTGICRGIAQRSWPVEI